MPLSDNTVVPCRRGNKRWLRDGRQASQLRTITLRLLHEPDASPKPGLSFVSTLQFERLVSSM